MSDFFFFLILMRVTTDLNFKFVFLFLFVQKKTVTLNRSQKMETKGHNTVKKRGPGIDPWVTSKERAVDEDDIFSKTHKGGRGGGDTGYSFQMCQTVIQTPQFTLSNAEGRSRRIKIQQAALNKEQRRASENTSGQRPVNGGATFLREGYMVGKGREGRIEHVSREMIIRHRLRRGKEQSKDQGPRGDQPSFTRLLSTPGHSSGLCRSRHAF